MVQLTQLTENDFEKMAQDINELSESNTENQLLMLIGNALHDSGMTFSTANSFELVTPKMFDQSIENVNLRNIVGFVAETHPLTPNEAENEGKGFWKRFKENLRVEICTNPTIKELMLGDGTLKDYLKVGIPLVLAALGLSVINPLVLTIIAAVFALIIKVGFNAYCSNEN